MVYCIGLENRRGESLRGFESLPVRLKIRAIGAAVSVAGLHPVGRGFESLIAHVKFKRSTQCLIQKKVEAVVARWEAKSGVIVERIESVTSKL